MFKNQENTKKQQEKVERFLKNICKIERDYIFFSYHSLIGVINKEFELEKITNNEEKTDYNEIFNSLNKIFNPKDKKKDINAIMNIMNYIKQLYNKGAEHIFKYIFKKGYEDLCAMLQTIREDNHEWLDYFPMKVKDFIKQKEIKIKFSISDIKSLINKMKDTKKVILFQKKDCKEISTEDLNKIKESYDKRDFNSLKECIFKFTGMRRISGFVEKPEDIDILHKQEIHQNDGRTFDSFYFVHMEEIYRLSNFWSGFPSKSKLNEDLNGSYYLLFNRYNKEKQQTTEEIENSFKLEYKLGSIPMDNLFTIEYDILLKLAGAWMTIMDKQCEEKYKENKIRANYEYYLFMSFMFIEIVLAASMDTQNACFYIHYFDF